MYSGGLYWMPFEPVSVAVKISAHNLDFIFGAVVPGNKNVKIRVLDHKLNQNIPYPILPDTFFFFLPSNFSPKLNREPGIKFTPHPST